MIEQPAGRADDDVDPAPEGVLLGRHADTAVDACGRDRSMDGQVSEVRQNLRRQLTRWREHERAGRTARPADEGVEDREEERGGLSASSHRRREDVAPFERRRNGVGLNRRRSTETELLETSFERGV